MFDPTRLLDQFLGAMGPDGRRAGPSSDTKHGLAAGALAGLLLGSRKGRRLGGTAVLAGLAYKAYNDWQRNKGSAGSQAGGGAQGVAGTPFLPDDAGARSDLSLAMLRAMIAAAKSDGHIDATEQQRIFAKLDEAGLDTEAKAFILDELRKPLDVDAVVRSATSPEVAAELYAASFVAIEPDDAGEKAYLEMLAARLKLEPGLKAQIESAARNPDS
jgi:uncharacterized membrane protein YebE (DUF533 family)